MEFPEHETLRHGPRARNSCVVTRDISRDKLEHRVIIGRLVCVPRNISHSLSPLLHSPREESRYSHSCVHHMDVTLIRESFNPPINNRSDHGRFCSLPSLPAPLSLTPLGKNRKGDPSIRKVMDRPSVPETRVQSRVV